MAGMPSRGLADVVAAATAVSDVDGTAGRLSYRGYDIGQLAGRATFEEVAFLLQRGTPPDRGELAGYRAELGAGASLGPVALEALPALARDQPPLAALRSLVSLGSGDDPDASLSDPGADQRKATRLTAQQPVAVAALEAARRGHPLPRPEPGASLAAALLHQLTGRPPEPREAGILDTCLVLYADHGLTASAFAARVCAATGADLHAAITVALATLSGPLHAGATEPVMTELAAIRRSAGTDPLGAAARAAGRRLASGEKILGFGHRSYPGQDPRGVILEQLAAELAREKDPAGYQLATAFARTIHEAEGQYPSADFWAAVVFGYLGLPAALSPAVLSVARMAGWTAHVIEQHADNRLIRPAAEYIGARSMVWTALEDR